MPTINELMNRAGLEETPSISRKKTSIEIKALESKVSTINSRMEEAQIRSRDSHNQIDFDYLTPAIKTRTINERLKTLSNQTSEEPQTLPHEEQKAIFSLLDKEDMKEAGKDVARVLGKTGAEVLGNKYIQTMIKTLGVGENVSVASLRYLTNLPQKENFTDNTMHDLFLEWAAPDNNITKATSFLASVFLDPLTYTGLGLGKFAKIGGKLLVGTSKTPLLFKGVESEILRGLSNAGRKQFNREIEEIVTQKTLGIAKEGLEEATKKARLEAQDIVVKKFTHLAEATNLKEKTGFLRKELFDRGGIKFAGRTLINGEELFKIMDKSGLIDVGKKLINSDVGQVAMKKTRPLQKSITNFMDSTGRFFIPQYSSNKKLMDMFKTAKYSSQLANNQILRNTHDLFSGLDEKQLSSFADLMIDTRLSNIKEGFTGVSDKLGNVPKSLDPKVQDVIDKWIGKEGKEGLIHNLAKEAGVPVSQIEEFYFPFIKEKANVITNFEPKNANRFFLEEAKGTLEDISRNPIHAVATRHMQIANANIQDELYAKFLTEFGVAKGTKTATQMLKEGFVSASEFSYKGQLQKSFLFGDPNIYKKVSKETLYVPKKYWDDFENAFGYSNAKIPFISWATNLWKAGVTTSPAFHFRNATSNVFLNSLDIGGFALSPSINAKSIKSIWGKMKKGGKHLEDTITTEQGEVIKIGTLLKEAQDHNALRKGVFYDMAGEGLPNDLRKAKEMMQTTWNPISPNFKLFGLSRQVGDMVENQARFTNFIANRIKGLDAATAARATDDVLFDYQNITKAEQWLKQAIPFFVFQRKFIGLAMKTLAHEPYKIANYLKFTRTFGPNENEWKQLPDWAKARATLKFGNLITTGFGLAPENLIQLADDPGGEILRNLNPMFRYGLEKMTGRDFFTQKRLDEIVRAQEFKVVFDILGNKDIPDVIKKPISKMAKFLDLQERTVKKKINGELKEVKEVYINPKVRHILQNMFTSRWMSEFKLLTDEEKTNAQFAAKWILGIVSLDIDEKHEFFRDRKTQQKASSQLRKKGLSYTFEKAIFKKGILPPFYQKQINNLEKKVRAFPDKEAGEISSEEFKVRLNEILEEAGTE